MNVGEGGVVQRIGPTVDDILVTSGAYGNARQKIILGMWYD